ncbi:thermonuclease family protein [uncultured Sphingomonas sp.]|uniref:thermonuclease family protein n=1 Tax=uncultured Sphingomonas sp. TaxID=158754 RepID=UPI00262B2782|nr:thermonuclease family protein [uncultured Sphingomonas sp.]
MSFLALACTLIAVDGDTLRCGQERIRLIGIDAPELPGHCHEGRSCAPGDPVASQAALTAASHGMAEIDRQGRDQYERTLARVRVNGVDLSCAQIAGGHAIYRADWDLLGEIGSECGIAKPVKRVAIAPHRTSLRAARPNPTPTSSSWSYRNCSEARRAGAAPLRRGQPGYGAHMDGDGDGIACEPFRR